MSVIPAAADATPEIEVTLLSWNVAGRVRRLAEQVSRVVELGVDIVCLQETTVATSISWADSLARKGWLHAAVAEPQAAIAEGQARPLMTLTAARTPLDVVEVAGVPWPEGALSARVCGLEIVNVHQLGVATVGWRISTGSSRGVRRWDGGYRLDHLVVSGEVAVREVSYLHDWREQGLSDHSALIARLAWPAGRADAQRRRPLPD